MTQRSARAGAWHMVLAMALGASLLACSPSSGDGSAASTLTGAVTRAETPTASPVPLADPTHLPVKAVPPGRARTASAGAGDIVELPSGATLTEDGVLRPAEVSRPIGALHLEVYESINQLLVVGVDDSVVRQIPVSGNPDLAKPNLSHVVDRIEMSSDYDGVWHLPFFVRLVEGRGIGAHAIPTAVSDGTPAQQVADLGLDPATSPRSHGCLRMTLDNARWLYEQVPPGTPVYWL